MLDTLHRLLMHGAQIVEEAMLPIGALSEEAREGSHEIFEESRQNHSRKHSRTATNTDVMCMLRALSDPFMDTVRIKPKVENLDLDEDVIDPMQFQ